mgnify:CR=1 FL=1
MKIRKQLYRETFSLCNTQRTSGLIVKMNHQALRLEEIDMKYSSDKHINQFVTQLVKIGWLFTSKHSLLISPDGLQHIFVASSPSDKRAFLNIKKHVKKFGFKKYYNGAKNERASY